jgi:hypothetical protein
MSLEKKPFGRFDGAKRQSRNEFDSCAAIDA